MQLMLRNQERLFVLEEVGQHQGLVEMLSRWKIRGIDVTHVRLVCLTTSGEDNFVELHRDGNTPRMIFYWQVSVPRPARRNDYHEMELLRPR